MAAPNTSKKEPSPKELLRRWREKRKAVSTLGENIESLKRYVKQDLESADEKEQLTALVVRLMIKTSERVGNGESAKNGHYGITEFRNKHVNVDGDRISLDYVGKSGMDHEKDFSDPKAAAILKKLLDRNAGFLFVTSDGFKIKADRVNRYLSQFNVTSKDIRGYNSNRLMVMELNKKGVVPEPDRKTVFNELLRKVAEKIGHGAPTLRKHYLLPEIEKNFYSKGTVGKIKIE